MVQSFKRLTLIAGLFAIALALPGCQVAGWVVHGLTPEKAPEVIEPEYQGLIGKSVAVMVAADDRTVYPNAQARICQYVTSRLVVDVPGIRVTDPKQIAKFTKENPDWIAIPYGDLIREMKVDRIVYISVAQYATHEQGNKELWQGTLVARVGVIEADAKDPYKFVYASNQQVMYPPDQPMGMLKANDEMIETGMLTAFAEKLGAIFRPEVPK